MERLILGMVCRAGETEIQFPYLSQYIQHATAHIQCRRLNHMVNGYEWELYSSVSKGNDKVTDKRTQRE